VEVEMMRLMSLRSGAARLVALLLLALLATPVHASEFTDSAGRLVTLPDHIGRVMAAEPAAEVLVFVLAPNRLIGWVQPPQGRVLPARYARLPVVGQLAGSNPTATAETVTRLHPDVIIDAGPVTPERAAFADQIQQATGCPYILLDSSIDRTPAMLRIIGKFLGVAEHGEDLATTAEHAINTLRGVLLIQSPTERPRVYYGRGSDGLETPLPGLPAEEVIANSGMINVVAPLGRGKLVRITRQQLMDWNPDVIIAETANFYDALHRDPSWLRLAAVRNKKVFLAPSLIFGWIDDPPGVNRLIGLYWLAGFRQEFSLRSVWEVTLEFYSQFYGVKLSDKQMAAMARRAGIGLSETPNPSDLPLTGPGTPPPGRATPGRAGPMTQ
jgi:iron complex transport system substrate-binding protein